MTEKEQIERLLALAEIQTADVASLLILLERLAQFVRQHQPDVPDVGIEFLKLRKIQLQHRLEAMEMTDPARAARFQQLIDQSCTIYPPTYE